MSVFKHCNSFLRARKHNVVSRFLCTASANADENENIRPIYRHPLSEAVYEEIVLLSPPWLDTKRITWDHAQGTFELKFSQPVTYEGGEKSVIEHGSVFTLYDSFSRNHFLAVHFAKLVGRVSLTDNKKSAWQSNIGADRDRTLVSVRELVEQINVAGKGIFPPTAEDEEGSLPPSNPV